MGKKSINSHVKQLLASKSCNPKNSFKKYNEIGSGEYGKVYKACINDKCANKIAVKNSTENMSAEFLITRKLEKLGVPVVYGYEKCANRDFLFSEFINGVTLKKFLKNKKVTGDELKSIIIQVLYILYTIHKKYPTFRHNDLHLDNIMILRKRKDNKKEINVGDNVIVFDEAKVEVKLMDFGLATMRGTINPILRGSSTFKNDYGIFPESDAAYDIHLFINSLYIEKKTPEFKKFVERFFKPEYLKKTSGVVNEYRLRSDVKHELPTYETLFKHAYFSKPKNTVKAFINKLPAPVKAKPVKKKESPVNQEKAKKNAMKVLAEIAKAKAKKAPTKAPTKAPKKPTLTKPPTKPMMVRGSPK